MSMPDVAGIAYARTASMMPLVSEDISYFHFHIVILQSGPNLQRHHHEIIVQCVIVLKTNIFAYETKTVFVVWALSSSVRIS